MSKAASWLFWEITVPNFYPCTKGDLLFNALVQARTVPALQTVALDPDFPLEHVPWLISRCIDSGLTVYRQNPSWVLWQLAQPDIEERGRRMYDKATKDVALFVGCRAGKTLTTLARIDWKNTWKRRP